MGELDSGDDDSAALPPSGRVALPEPDPEMSAMLKWAAEMVRLTWNPPPAELLEYCKEQNSGPTETFSEAPGAYGIRSHSNAAGFASYVTALALASWPSPKMGIAEWHAPCDNHPGLPQNPQPVVRAFVSPGRSAPRTCVQLVSLNTATRAQLSGEGPRVSFMEFVESCWCPVNHHSPSDLSTIYTSTTEYLVPSQNHTDCEGQQHEPTTGCERVFAVTFEPTPTRATEQNITTEPEQPPLQSLATPATQSSLPPISPSVSPQPPLSGMDPPLDCWEPSPPMRQEPLAPSTLP
ncbi:hypothetical protein PO909_030349 [Leuciscus waleckii]